MNKKILIAIGIILGLALVASGFWYVQEKEEQVIENQEQQKQDNRDEIEKTEGNIGIKHLSQEEIEKLKQDKDLVWYEVPELGIKFLVTPEIAKNIGYRDFYVEENLSGYTLYAKDYPLPSTSGNVSDSFARIVDYPNYGDDPYMQWAIDCKGDECCPADPKIRKLLIKTDSNIVCYLNDSFSEKINRENGIYQKLSPISKKLFDGYLKTVPVELIK